MRKNAMQTPSGGCNNCGGPVRTYKPDGLGWICAKCVKLLYRPDGSMRPNRLHTAPRT